LMKNSRRSDRELAKVIGCSQPTVTRARADLERNGYIKEYTIIPDFEKLGFSLMGVTLARRKGPRSREAPAKTRTAVIEIEKQHPHASLMAVNTTGIHDTLFITLYKDYSAYTRAMQLMRTIPKVEIDRVESYLVDLADPTNYRLLSMLPTATYLTKAESQPDVKD
jgi:DNA-binding Lrp family transcriptional regulator